MLSSILGGDISKDLGSVSPNQKSERGIDVWDNSFSKSVRYHA